MDQAAVKALIVEAHGAQLVGAIRLTHRRVGIAALTVGGHRWSSPVRSWAAVGEQKAKRTRVAGVTHPHPDRCRCPTAICRRYQPVPSLPWSRVWGAGLFPDTGRDRAGSKLRPVGENGFGTVEGHCDVAVIQRSAARLAAALQLGRRVARSSSSTLTASGNAPAAGEARRPGPLGAYGCGIRRAGGRTFAGRRRARPGAPSRRSGLRRGTPTSARCWSCRARRTCGWS